jgi:WD40 repeat protein
LTGPGDTVFGLAWAANGTLAAAVSDGHVWLWDLTDPGSPIAQSELSAGDASLYSVSLQGEGSRVLAGGSAAGVVSWQTDPQAVATEICATTGSPITEAEWTRVAPGVAFDPPCAAATTD